MPSSHGHRRIDLSEDTAAIFYTFKDPRYPPNRPLLPPPSASPSRSNSNASSPPRLAAKASHSHPDPLITGFESRPDDLAVRDSPIELLSSPPGSPAPASSSTRFDPEATPDNGHKGIHDISDSQWNAEIKSTRSSKKRRKTSERPDEGRRSRSSEVVDMTVDESPKGGKIMATQLTDLQKTAEKWIGIEERLSERKREADSRGSLLDKIRSKRKVRRIVSPPPPATPGPLHKSKAGPSSVTLLDELENLREASPSGTNGDDKAQNAARGNHQSSLRSPNMDQDVPEELEAELAEAAWGDGQDARAAPKPRIEDLFAEDSPPRPGPSRAHRPREEMEVDYDAQFDDDAFDDLDPDSFSFAGPSGSHAASGVSDTGGRRVRPLAPGEQNVAYDVAIRPSTQFDLSGYDFEEDIDLSSGPAGEASVSNDKQALRENDENRMGKHGGIIHPITLVHELPDEYQEFYMNHWRRTTDRTDKTFSDRTQRVTTPRGGKKRSFAPRGRGRGRGRARGGRR